MLLIGPDKYDVFLLDDQTTHVTISDHMGGFDHNFKCLTLDRLQKQSNGRRLKVQTEYVFDTKVKTNYPNFEFGFLTNEHVKWLETLRGYNTHPEVRFSNFLCTFNGTPHVGRKLLVSILHRFGWFNAGFSSKNFAYTVDQLDGHISEYVDPEQNALYRMWFSLDPEFASSMVTFDYQRYNHAHNIQILENKLTQSFVHLVSETLPTSYHAFYGEKFLYSVVTRGLFLAFAQPFWHDCLEKYYGFKRYDRIFDYSFDSVLNPVQRLCTLVGMLAKFDYLTIHDWQDLYEMEKDTIEYNYHHYFSGRYLQRLGSVT